MQKAAGAVAKGIMVWYTLFQNGRISTFFFTRSKKHIKLQEWSSHVQYI